MYYYRARYYSTDLRRFLQPDPIGFTGGMNLYAYVRNSPISLVDLFGLKEFPVIINSMGAGIGVLSLEGGNIFVIDEENFEIHEYQFFAYGVGLGWGFNVTAQVGILESESPEEIAGWGLEVSGFIAAKEGLSAQIFGTGPGGSGAAGVAFGPAYGIGAEICGMGNYSKYAGKYPYDSLPDYLNEIINNLPADVRGLIFKQSANIECPE